MADEKEVKLNETWGEESYAPRKRRVGSDNSKMRLVLVGILIIVLIGAFFLFFRSGGKSGDETKSVQAKMNALEQKLGSLEKQLADLSGKVGTAGSDPALVQKVEALAQKVDSLEKRPEARAPKAPPPSKPSAAPPAASAASSTTTAPAASTAVSADKRYHTVQKGETLYGISKRYGISVEELRKLNNLAPDQSLRSGQKLVLSPGR